jgi:hypothetical protein
MSKLAVSRTAEDAMRVDFLRSRKAGRNGAATMLVLAAGIVALGGLAAPRTVGAEPVSRLAARVVAIGIPGASALAQIGTFLDVPPPESCANPIPSKFPDYIKLGAVLDPNRILVGSASNFGAQRAIGAGAEGSFLSIDPNRVHRLVVPSDFATGGGQASTLGGAVQMFSANSPDWFNGVNNPTAVTKQYTGVSNPLGL